MYIIINVIIFLFQFWARASQASLIYFTHDMTNNAKHNTLYVTTLYFPGLSLIIIYLISLLWCLRHPIGSVLRKSHLLVLHLVVLIPSKIRPEVCNSGTWA